MRRALKMLAVVGMTALSLPLGVGAASADGEVRQAPEAVTVTLDPATGSVVEVTEGAPMRTQVSTTSGCNGVRACTAPRVPYQIWQWGGSAGSATVNWPGQLGFDTNSYTASTCWIFNGNQVCSGYFAPNTYVDIGAQVTIVRARLR